MSRRLGAFVYLKRVSVEAKETVITVANSFTEVVRKAETFQRDNMVNYPVIPHTYLSLWVN